MVSLVHRNLHDFLQDPFFQHKSVGFDRLVNMALERGQRDVGSYPPYNIKRIDGNKFCIELALAGFSKDDLKVEYQKNNLSVSGNMQTNDGEYIHRGISERKFKREWTLADHVQVKGCDFENGMLMIYLEEVLPEEEKLRVIEIGGGKNFSKKFLTEDKGSKRK